MENNSTEKNMTFEQALSQLNEIANKLKSKEISLEDTIKYYEDGSKCFKLCQDILNDAKQKIDTYQGE